MTWVSADDRAHEAHDVGGDGQRGQSYSRRFYRLEDGDNGRKDSDGETLFSVLTMYFYGETRMEDSYDESGVAKDSDGLPILWMTTRAELMVCTDRGDPGSTERWCDYAESESEASFMSIDEAEGFSEGFAEAYTAELANRDIDWDGLAPWEKKS